MKIDAMVPDVESFVIEYNRFIDNLTARIRAEGDLDMFFRVRAWWRIFELPKVYKDHILLDFMLTNEGHLILECTDPNFSNEFERFWQECQARWGIADQDANLEIMLQDIDMHTSVSNPELEQITSPRLPTDLLPSLQHWYYIVLQSEYESTNHRLEYTKFCYLNGLKYDTYKGNKNTLKKLEFNLRAWVPDKKPPDAHEKVKQAIIKKRERGWTKEPVIHP